MRFVWELLHGDDEGVQDTCRAKVHDGWLVRERFGDEGVSITFVPDLHHLWKIDNTSFPPPRDHLCSICGFIYAVNSKHNCNV